MRQNNMKKEVFVPLYLSNICHGRCSICNLRKQNDKVIRVQGDKKKLDEQLEILYKIERIKEICFLTGELKDGKQREKNLEFVMYAVERALQYGFRRVFINIGSLTDKEILYIRQLFPDNSRLVLSLFQETYNKELYKKYFGLYESDNPKSDYDRRLTTPERWIKAGFIQVDLGILLGLNPYFKQDLNALIQHAKYLYGLGAKIYLSLPRIYNAGEKTKVVSDEEFVQCIYKIKQVCPWAKVIVTTRESIEMIRRLLPIIDVVSPGSSDVMPYTWEGDISNNESTSQFIIEKKRKRPSEVLNALENFCSGNL